jgi:signal peptidase
MVLHMLTCHVWLPLLLQGDNNYGDDRLLYARGQEWLHMKHIMGRAVG